MHFLLESISEHLAPMPFHNLDPSQDKFQMPIRTSKLEVLAFSTLILL